jgi:hypothetical protein
MKARAVLNAEMEIPFLMHFQEIDAEPLIVNGEYKEEMQMWIGNDGTPVAAGPTKRQGPTNKRTYNPATKTSDYETTTDTYAD